MTIQALGPNQERWLAALESGRYEQTIGELRKGDSFCCLGVACEIEGLMKRENSNKDWEYLDEDDDGDESWEGGNAPQRIINTLGLYNEEGRARGEEKPSLVSLNDGVQDKLPRHSFVQIAEIIRSDPRMYFKEPR